MIIPIERPDRMTSLGQRNLIGEVTEVESNNYTIGTRDGILTNGYSRNQFELCATNFIQPNNIPSSSISQTTAMRNASFGIIGGAFCRFKHCKTNRCACRKALEVTTLNVINDRALLTRLKIHYF